MNRDLKFYFLFIGLPALLLALGGLRLLSVESARAYTLGRDALQAKATLAVSDVRRSIREYVDGVLSRVEQLPEDPAPEADRAGELDLRTALQELNEDQRTALLLQQERYDGSQLAALRITPELLNALLQRLSALGDEKRAQMPLLVRRHDVILQGGLILSWFMENLSIKALTPTDRGGMKGFAGWLFEKGIV